MDNSNKRKLVENNYSQVFPMDSNTIVTVGSINNTDELNVVELNNARLNRDTEYLDKQVFIVKKSSNVKLTVNYQNFKMKRCNKVRSILFGEEKLNSIYHPKDDSHAFYIKKSKNGIFNIGDINIKKQGSIQLQKRQMINKELEKFVAKLNLLTDSPMIEGKVRTLTSIKVILYILILICIGVIGYLFFNFLLYFLSLFLRTVRVKHEDIIEDILKILLFLLCLAGIYYNHRAIKYFRAKQKILMFLHINGFKEEILKELEKFNETVCFIYNMRCELSETLDYIQVFYDRRIVYEIDDHNFN